MHIRITISFILLASELMGYGVEVMSQRCAVSSFAELSSSPMTGVLDRDDDFLENQDIGDQALRSDSEANFETVAVRARSEVVLRRTNTPTSDVFWIESSFNMHSEGDLLTVSTNLITKAFALTSVSFQLQADTPFRYSIATSGQSPPVLPNSGGITIRTASGHPVLEMHWDSATGNLPESQGSLPPGVYQIEFFSSALAQGEISPIIQNHIGGTAGTALALTITPRDFNDTPRAALHLRRGDGDLVLLEMTDLQPGTFYFIERSEEMTPGLWPIVANFIAGGTNAVWADSLNHQAQNVFYRLRF